MKEFFDFLITLLSQFAGGPGPVENNLVRFGLAAIFWAVLFYIAWSRQRSSHVPREKLLVWGFGLALVREFYMFAQIADRVVRNNQTETSCSVTEPIEHALAMVAVIVVAGAFLRYMLDNFALSRRYLQIGLGMSALSLVITAIIWPAWWASTPGLRFHQTWLAWLFHLPLSLMLVIAIYYLWKRPGWIRNVVSAALCLFVLSEVLFLLNYTTSRAYAKILCPVGNGLHIFAIPLLGYVYLREQQLEKEQAEAGLRTYRDHLQELVAERTAELTSVNELLKQEISERQQAEEALARISQRDELILTSAGEGICGIDKNGRLTFVNPAAAAMLGYHPDELINQYSHDVWHCFRNDGRIYLEEDCPICASFRLGEIHSGDDEFFCRKDGSLFPVRFFSNPAYENGELAGAVVVFQDITERKRIEAEIASRNSSLAIQNAVAAALSQSLDISVSLKSALDMLLESLSMKVGIIFLIDAEDKSLKISLYSGEKSLEDMQRSVSALNCPLWQTSSRAQAIGQAVTLPEIGSLADQLLDSRCGERLYYLISAPLASKGQVIGVITLGSAQPGPIRPHDVDLLTAVGQQMGMAVENARLYQEAECWAADLVRLQDASAFLNTSLDEKHITSLVAEKSAWLMNCQMACVITRDEHTGRLELSASSGMGHEAQRTVYDQLDTWEKCIGLAKSPQIISVLNAREDPSIPGTWLTRLNLQALLCTPVWGAEQPLMYLLVLDVKHSRHWSPQELERIEAFAARAAVALMNARLHKQLEMAAALEERQRIAAEMHDGLAQMLGLLGLRVDQVSERVSGIPDQETTAALQTMREVVTQASAEVRRSIASLQDAPKPRISLQEEISQMVERYEAPENPTIIFDNRVAKPLFPAKDQLQQVLPLLQEALLNARNHAHAATIRIVLESTNGEVFASVADDGIGFDQNAATDISGHFGLTIMQARAERIGGKLSIDSACGQGTSVRLTWKPQLEENQRRSLTTLERLR